MHSEPRNCARESIEAINANLGILTKLESLGVVSVTIGISKEYLFFHDVGVSDKDLARQLKIMAENFGEVKSDNVPNSIYWLVPRDDGTFCKVMLMSRTRRDRHSTENTSLDFYMDQVVPLF